MSRIAEIDRKTTETHIKLSLNLDGDGTAALRTGIPFLDHMLEQIAHHGLVDLAVDASGDLDVDAHHTVEDIGICFGEALHDALGDKRGIARYGHAYVPLDEALSRVVLDLSGRPALSYHVPFSKERIGDFEVDLFKEFFQAVANHARIALHIDTLRGDNNHHMIETVFKAFGRALRMAVARDARQAGVPSTKGAL